MGASPSLLLANTESFNVSNGGAPSFGCVIGDRGYSECANSISSVDTPPSFSDLARDDASRASVDQNLDEVKFEEEALSTLDGSRSSGASNNTSNNSHFLAPSGQILPHPNLRIFTFSELKTATRSFRSDTVLGDGGFGKVYKGWIKDKSNSKHNVIAVKKLNSESMQGLEEWQAEVDFLGRLSHANLVKLFGYCYEGTELLLVYEFMQKGSLENHLFGRGSIVQPVPWDIRLKILIGAARGLMFLHASDKQVIYRDFKASNILLDGSYNAKISDFGLAKLGPSASQSHITTRVMGTYGYAAPEYVSTGHLYVKSDVYGFGIVMVEMLTGMRALDTGRPVAQQNLSDWVKPYLADRRKLKNIMDSRLEGRYPSKAAGQTAQLALTCLLPEPKTRPSMKEVVERLEQLDTIKEKSKVPRVQNSTRQSPYRHGQQPPNLSRSPQTQAGNRRSPKGWWNYKNFTKGSLALQY